MPDRFEEEEDEEDEEEEDEDEDEDEDEEGCADATKLCTPKASKRKDVVIKKCIVKRYLRMMIEGRGLRTF